jgi:hypothetical protein
VTQHRRAQAIGELSSIVARAIRVSATEIIQVQADNERHERVRSITARLTKDQVAAARSMAPTPTPPDGLDPQQARRLVDEIHALADSIGHLDRLAGLDGPALHQGVQAHRQIFQALTRRLGAERAQRFGFDMGHIGRLLDQVGQA